MQEKKDIFFYFLAIILFFQPLMVFAQASVDDPRILLQGFYWESYRFGSPELFPALGEKKWYEIVQEKAKEIREGRMDLLWLPPPSFAGSNSAGYNPKEYFNLNNNYGSAQQHRTLLETLLEYGIEPIADIVINHRDSSETSRWASFKNPDWDLKTITQNDEAFTNPESDLYQTPLELRGKEEDQPLEYAPYLSTTYNYPSFRDMDHRNREVRRDILRYLLQLKSLGYRGWRYDMVHGYHARWIALYNRATLPTFSVGEYDWDQHNAQRGWVWHSSTIPNDFQKSSSVFDFSTYFTLKNNKGNYLALYGAFNTGIGLIADTTDGYLWKNRSVTFLENHDTGYRTDDSGRPQPHHEHDSFLNDWQVQQAYAYILTHPGVPSIYWKHYFDWGSELREKIKALINARKVAKVHSGSSFHPQHNARERGVYAASILGKAGTLYVRIGGSDSEWTPHHSHFSDYREYAGGLGWKVWVALPSNPELQEAPLNTSFSIPEYQEATEIFVNEDLINE